MTLEQMMIVAAIDLASLFVFVGYKLGCFLFTRALDKESSTPREELPKHFGKRQFRKEVVYSMFKPKNKEELIAAKKWVREKYPFMSMKVEQE